MITLALIYLFILFVSNIVVFRAFLKNKDLFIIFLILIFSLLAESIGFILNIKRIDNQNIFCFYNLINCVLVFYYNSKTDIYEKRKQVFYLFLALLLASILIIFYIYNSPSERLTHILILSSILIVINSLIKILTFFNGSNNISLKNRIDYWVTINFFTFWSINILSWGLRFFLFVHFPIFNKFWNIIMLTGGILYYAIMAYLVSCYNKIKYE